MAPKLRTICRIVKIESTKAWFDRPPEGHLGGQFWESVRVLEGMGYDVQLGTPVTFITPDYQRFFPDKVPA